MSEADVDDSNRRFGHPPLQQTDETVSLTSFPDPAPTHSPRLQPVNGSLHGLLDRPGPSMFDENDKTVGDPQTLSAASAKTIQTIIENQGAVQLVRRLSALLAERDAHVTALIRLAEEYKIPVDRIADTADRAKRAERRRLSLAGASEDNAPTNPSKNSDHNISNGSLETSEPQRNITQLFAGFGKRRSIAQTTASVRIPSPSGSHSRTPSKSERPRSLDIHSVHSVEGTSWTTSLFGGGTNIAAGIMNWRVSGTSHEPVEMSTRHDIDQLPPTLSQPSKDPQESEWNKFLLKLMKSREQAGVDARSGELIGASRFGNEGSTGRQKMELLTRLVIGGIPMRLRHPIWMELSNTYALMQPDAYEYYLNLRGSEEDSRDIDTILKDVPRTLTSKYDFYVEKGYERLKRVLIAFVGKYPGLGYTQGLNMIAGYLLLAIPDESDAFWVLCNMVDNFFPADYFSKEAAMQAPISDNVVLRQYVKELAPKLSDKMNDLGIDPEHTVPLSWFLTAFASVLPESVLLRIWDVWLCLPGQKTFLFNVALALLMLNTKELCECETPGEYFAYMSGRCRVAEDPEKINELIRHAFLMRKKLEQVELRRALAMKKLKKNPSLDVLYSSENSDDLEV